jgi:nitrite reductase/ring-hydroxylating ferredoxin subunit/uncharacterized membrane protein
MRLFHRIADMVDRQTWLDRAADPLKKGIKAVFRAGGGPGRAVKDFLHGTWLGHPLHPVLVSIPIGAWTVALVFDVIDAVRGTSVFSTASDGAIVVGICGAVAAAITGLTDFQHTGRSAMRVAFAHGMINLGATGLYVVALVLRLEEMRGPGRALSWIGYGLIALAGFLGGHLSYAMRIGVNQAMEALEEQPKRGDYEPVLSDSQLSVGHPKRVDVKNIPVLLVRQGGRIHALADTCSHLGCSLAAGKLGPDRIVCGCHGSEFALADGRVLSGPAVYPQPLFDVRVRDGMIEVGTTAHTWSGHEVSTTDPVQSPAAVLRTPKAST